MAVSIGSLYLDLRASTEGLRKDAAKAVQQMRRVGNDMAKAVAVGAVAAGAGLAVVIKQASDRIDKLAKSADALGVPIERLRALQEIGDKSGVAFEETNKALQDLQKNVGLAAAGASKSQYAFRALGIEATELLALSPDKQFEVVADALNKVENATVRATYAEKLFGETGAKLFAIMREGSEGIDAADKKLQSLGVTLSRVDAAKVEIANDAISDLKLVIEGAGNQLAVQFAPVIKSIADLLMKAAGETKGFSDWIVKLVDWGVSGVGMLADAFRGWQLVIKGGQIALITVVQAFEYVRKAGEVGMLALASVVSEAIRGWEMIGVSVKIAFFALMEATKSGIQASLDFVLSGINKVIGAINRIAKTKIDPISLDIAGTDFAAQIADANEQLDSLVDSSSTATDALSQSVGEFAQFRADMEAGTDSYSQAIKQTWGETVNLLNQPLPSDQLKAWVEKTRAEAQAGAVAIAEAVKPTFDAIKIEPLKEEDIEKTRKRFDSLRDTVFNPWLEAYESIQDQIGGLVRGTLSWRDALVEVANTFLTTVIQALVQMAAQWVAQQFAMMMGMQAAQTAASTAATATAATSAAAIQAAWIPAAIAASIATMGAASGVGLGAFISALALGSAAAVGIGAIASVASGFLNTAGTAYGQSAAGQRAHGGDVTAGELYRVNENGPEFFRPHADGEVIPMGKMVPQTDGTMGGISISQTFTGGVTERDLARQAQKTKQETLAAVIEGVSRGGQFRKGVRR